MMEQAQLKVQVAATMATTQGNLLRSEELLEGLNGLIGIFSVDTVVIIAG